MTTLHHLNLTLLDVQERIQRELQFTSDAEKQILDAVSTVVEAVGHLDRCIKAAFSERTRALSAALGSGKPTPETVDMIEAKPVKAKKVEEVDA